MSRSFRFGTVGSPKSTPKKPGGSVRAVLRIRELGLSALELGWVRSVRASGNPVTLGPETIRKSALLGSPQDILAMSPEISREGYGG